MPGKECCIFHEREKDAGLFEARIRAKLDSGDYDFTGFYFPERITFGNATFQHAGNFFEATFAGDADFAKATFNRGASFTWALFQASADFSMTTFVKEADFRGARFYKDADFLLATFKSNAYFERVVFNGITYFICADFNGRGIFTETTFVEIADLHEATFKGDLFFEKATLKGPADFHEAIFECNAFFQEAAFEGVTNFQGANFKRVGLFERANFEGEADFRGATFKRDGRFSAATFKGVVSFSDATFEKQASFRKAKFSSRVASLPLADFRSEVDFQEAEFKHPAEKAAAFRLSKISYQREGQYDKAGDCYYVERVAQWQSVKWSLRSFFAKFVELIFLRWTCGYGERPRSVFGWVFGIVGLFTLLFYLQKDQILSTPSGYVFEFWNALYFSGTIFLTMGVGGPWYPAPDHWIKFLVLIEGFLGAFFLALFVMTFGRRMMR